MVLDDLPPLMWHAELGRALPDMWSGRHHRGVQLHDLRGAVVQWGSRYGQRGWLRQLDPDGGPPRWRTRCCARSPGSTARRSPPPRGWPAAGCAGGCRPGSGAATSATLETAYCAEVVAVTYEDMGLLRRDRRPNWYDPGRFWSGDRLTLREGYALGAEIGVTLPPK